MRHDIISDVLYVLGNMENIGKKTCVVPSSAFVKGILSVMKNNGYIGSFEFIDDSKSGSVKIELIGKINKTRAIRPRFAVKKNEYEKWEKRYLPAHGFGILIVSTSKGIMSQNDAVKKGLGGRLVGYVY